MNYLFTSRQLTLDNLSRSHDFQKVASPKWSIFLSNLAWNTYSKSYMVFQFTPLHLTLGGIERSNQDHWVLIWLCIIDTKAIRDGRPRPPRHQVGWDIVRRECACQISCWSVEKWRIYYILKFHGNTFWWPTTLTFDLNICQSQSTHTQCVC